MARETQRRLGPTAVDAAGGAPSAEVQRYALNVDEPWDSVAGCR